MIVSCRIMPQAATITTELPIRLSHKFHMIVTVASPQLMEVHILYSILRLALDGI